MNYDITAENRAKSYEMNSGEGYDVNSGVNT